MAEPNLTYSARTREALAFMEAVDPEPTHARQVHRLMQSLLKSSQDLHNFTPARAAIAESAALLHDIGWSRSAAEGGKAHHKYSAAMIREHSWTNFSPSEAELTAQIARYHRKKLPGPKHPEFMALSSAEQDFVCQAASFLRLADALDRAHRASISFVILEKAGPGWIVRAKGSGDCDEERFGFNKKKDLFERTFTCPVTLSLFPS